MPVRIRLGAPISFTFLGCFRIFIRVIKLKSIINEIVRHHENLYSWLSVDGRFFPVKGKVHGEAARDIIGDYTTHNIETKMYRMGFVRVTYENDEMFAHNELHPPSDKQRRKLVDLAINTNINYIYYDKGEHFIPLWSSFNKL